MGFRDDQDRSWLNTGRPATFCLTNFERFEQVRAPPAEGVYVHGVFLDGSGWNRHESILVESQPKVLFQMLPVLFVTANTKGDQAKLRKEQFGPQGPYECPVYKYPKRTDRFFIFMVTLRCTEVKPPWYWTLRGVALLCNKD